MRLLDYSGSTHYEPARRIFDDNQFFDVKLATN